jgi:hypothetical protein
MTSTPAIALWPSLPAARFGFAGLSLMLLVVFPDTGHHLIPGLGPGAAVERRLQVALDQEL